MRISENILYFSKTRVYSDSEIASICHATNKIGNSLWCLTVKGDVYHVNDGKLNSQIRQKEEGNTDIFSDLLEENELELQLTSEPVYVLKPEDVVLHIPDKPVTMCVNSTHIAIVVISTDCSKVLVYENVEMPDPACANRKDMKPLKCINLPSKSLNVYNEQLVHSCLCMKFVSSDLNHVEEGVYKSTGGMVIQNELFKKLFGEEVALLESSVIVLGTESGRIYFIPVAFLSLFSTEQSEDNLINSTLCPWKELGHLPSAVLHIFPLLLCRAAHPESCESHVSDNSASQTCLAVCSMDGTLTVFYNARDGCHPICSRLTLLEPVVAVCALGDSIFHCTQERLYQTRVVSETTSGTNGVQVLTVRISTRLIDQCSVKDLIVHVDEGYIQSCNSPITIACTLSTGEVKTITVPPASNHFPDLSGSLADNTTTSGKSVMSVIERLSEQITEARQQRTKQTAWIQQLSIAAWMLHSYHQTERTNAVPQNAVKCCLAPISDTHSGKPMIHCDISHSLPHSLSTDWSVMVTLLPHTRNESVMSESHSHTTSVTTRTFKLDTDWSQAKVLSVVLDAEVKMLLQGCVLVVKFVLDCEKMLTSISSTGKETVLSVPVFVESLDLLELLVPCSSGTHISPAERNKAWDITTALAALAADRLGHVQENGKVTGTMCIKRRFHLTSEVDGGVTDAKSLLHCLVPQLTKCDTRGTDQQQFTFYGHQVQLYIDPASDEGAVDFTIRGEDSLVAAFHLAVVRKLKKHVQLDRRPIELKHVRQSLHSLEDILSDLQHNETETGHSDPEKMRRAYTQLRQLLVL